MKVSTAEPEAENVHPPLARDALGHLLALPEGAASWRISRHTAGRPRVLTGPDGTPMRFPLSTTAAELVDLCGPDTYRVYALDELGEVLDFVTTIQASRPRNANVPDVPLAALKGTHDAAPTTDLRFALHALTEIARINGEALRAISDSQADWIKTLAMNKGLPRNVAFPVFPPPREEPDYESDDDHGDAEDEADPTASPMMQFLSTVTPLIPGLVATWQGKKDEPAEPGESDEPPAPVTVNGMAHLARVQQQLTPRERAFLAALLADERGNSVAAELSVMPVEKVVALVREHCSKPPARPQSGEPTSKQIRDRVLALLPRLSPATQMRLMALAPKVSVTSQVPPEFRRMLAELARLDDAGAIAWLEANFDDLEKAFAP
jgi:hypothetical protein